MSFRCQDCRAPVLHCLPWTVAHFPFCSPFHRGCRPLQGAWSPANLRACASSSCVSHSSPDAVCLSDSKAQPARYFHRCKHQKNRSPYPICYVSLCASHCRLPCRDLFINLLSGLVMWRTSYEEIKRLLRSHLTYWQHLTRLTFWSS